MVDFKVNTLPSRFGEKVCLRLLDSSATQLGLDKLISNPTTLELVQDLRAELPTLTRLLVNLSELLRSAIALYIVGALLLIIWLFARYYATHNGRRVIDRLILKLPLFSELILMTATPSSLGSSAP